MASDRRNMPEQELSIKKREQELFLEASEEQVESPARPFEEYLRETPAAPLSIGVKVLLWIAGVVVAILFAAAIWKAGKSSAPHSKRPPVERPAAETSTRLYPRLPIPARIASQTKERTDPASVARRHRESSRLGGRSIRQVLHVPNSGRRVES
jgi:hypothetical protein